MNTKLSFTWSYDPFGIISTLRIQLKSTPYNHTPRPELEKYTNQEEWSEGTLQEAYENIISTPHVNTLVTKTNPLNRTTEETTFDPNLVKDSIIQPKNLNIGLIMSSGSRKLDFIDLGDQEEASRIGTTDPNYSFSKPMEIIQSKEANTAGYVNRFSKYREIKQNNETLKAHMYIQFWKQTSTSQHRLPSAFDSEKGRM